MLSSIVAEHRGYVSKGETDQSTGVHFNKPGYSLADLSVSVIEHTRGRGTEYRKEREHYFIQRFDTYYTGMNKQNESWEREGFSLICNQKLTLLKHLKNH